MRFQFEPLDRWQLLDMLRGFLIYAAGDLIGQVIVGQASLVRTIGFGFIGATIYALEIPIWFRLIEGTTCDPAQQPRLRGLFRNPDESGICRLNSVGKTIMALVYFNPVWLARHMFFISLLNCLATNTPLGNPWLVFVHLLPVAGKSFLIKIPLALAGNYVVQNFVALRWRFVGSATFSAINAVWYAVSKVIFGGR
jgi:hypothetical protein